MALYESFSFSRTRRTTFGSESSRGKARYIFEFKFELKCAYTMIDPEVYATIKFPEVSSDEDCGIEKAPYVVGLSLSLSVDALMTPHKTTTTDTKSYSRISTRRNSSRHLQQNVLRVWRDL